LPRRRNNLEVLVEQTRKHRPEAISIIDPAKAQELRDALGTSTEVFSGPEGLVKLATLPGADIVVIAIVGTAGLQPALAAIRAGKDIAVASKEILVMAGSLVMSEARKQGVRVLAVDSEHSAIFQMPRVNPPVPFGGFGSPLPAVLFGPRQKRSSRASPSNGP